MPKHKMPNGKEYNFGSPPFSKDVAAVLEFYSERDEADETDNRQYARLMVSLRKVINGSLINGGHTEDEAEEAICSLPFGEEIAEHLPGLMKAIGVA